MLRKMLSLAVVLFLSTFCAANTMTFNVTLSGAQEVPPLVVAATGSLTAILDDVAATLDVSLTFANLSSLPVHFLLHNAAAGMNGPVLLFLDVNFPFATSGTYAQSFTGLTSSTIAAIEAGDTYVNLHTVDYPAGEIRAQLSPPNGGSVPEPTTFALMSGGVIALLRKRRA